MSSDERTSLPPAPSAAGLSDGQRIAWVLSVVLAVIVLGVSGAAALGIEALFAGRPGGAVIDTDEMKQAEQRIGHRTQQLAELESKSGELLREIQSQRASWEGQRDQEAIELKSRLQGSYRSGSQLPSTANTLSESSLLYCQLFPRNRSSLKARLQKLQELSDEQQQDFAALVLQGTRLEHADVSIAMLAMRHTRNGNLKAEFVRELLRHPAPLSERWNPLNDVEIMGAALELAANLPAEEHASSLSLLALAAMHPSEPMTDLILVATQSVGSDHLSKLAPLVAHTDARIRDWVGMMVPRDACFDAAVAAIHGDDFPQFVSATRWLAEQPVDASHREKIVAALTPFIMVPDGERYLVLQTVTQWASSEQTETLRPELEKYLVQPIVRPAIREMLVRLATKLDLPLKEVIDQSHPIFYETWFAAYAAGDPAMRTAVVSRLSDDPPTRASLNWMESISRSGTRENMNDLSQAVARFVKSSPEANWLPQLRWWLQDMQTRLGPIDSER